jgi:molybdate transport system ATP-binding protein
LGHNGSGKTVFALGLRGALPLANGEVGYHFRVPKGTLPEDLIEHVSFDQHKRFTETYSPYLQSRYESLSDEGDLTVTDFLSQEEIEEVNPFEVSKTFRNRSGYRRRREETVALLKIDSLLKRKVAWLSHGEMRKVILARALIKAPLLLILDDPFVGLDKAYRTFFKRVIQQLMSSRMRVLLITSRRDEIPSAITHVAFVKDYCLVAAGRKAKMLRSRLLGDFFSRADACEPILRKIPKPTRGSIKRINPLVEINRLNIIYDRKKVLHEISWTIQSGERWALVGPNGSGKSTLLGVIYGDNPQAYANDVTIMGKKRGEGASIWEVKKKIGFVSPELQLHFDDSIDCFEVVCSGFNDSIGLYRVISSRQKRSAREWMQGLGLTAVAADPFGALSTGTQRMALLARALVKAPELLLLDEPCQGLDVQRRLMINRLIDQLAGQSRLSIVYVTHHFTELPGCVERIARINNGRITRFEKRKTQ